MEQKIALTFGDIQIGIYTFWKKYTVCDKSSDFYIKFYKNKTTNSLLINTVVICKNYFLICEPIIFTGDHIIVNFIIALKGDVLPTVRQLEKSG